MVASAVDAGAPQQLSITTADVVWHQRCPWAWVSHTATTLQGGYPVPPIDNPMRDVMSRTLSKHQSRVRGYLQNLSEEIDIESAPQALRTTSDALGQEKQFLFRPVWTWRDERFPLEISHRAEALVKNPAGRYDLWRSKLGRSSMHKLLLESSGALSGLEIMGVAVNNSVTVAFASGSVEVIDLSDYREEWLNAVSGLWNDYCRWRDGAALEWFDSPFDQCGRLTCEWCQDALSRNDDLFHIARLRRSHRQELRQRGIHTMSGFAESSLDEITARLPAHDEAELRSAHLQASLQVLSTHQQSGSLTCEVTNPDILRSLADVRDGDIYLDFESDPSYVEWPPDSLFRPDQPDGGVGIEYLIGILESGPEEFRYFWANSFEDEAECFRGFLDEIVSRSQDPSFRVYHYAPYEVQALTRLAERHGYGQHLITELVGRGVLVDLYKVVMRSVAIGSPSYSLKKLEALYFDGSERSGITTGAASVLAFSEFLAKKETDATAATTLQNAILAYNRLDCLSTKKLHEWLLRLRDET